MDNNNANKIKNVNTGKNYEKFRRMHMFKDSANKAMELDNDFDKNIITANDEYIAKLEKADVTEYDILRLNMENAETAEERAEIRKRMAEMKDDRYRKDTENKEFYERQQEGHRNHTMRILGTVALVAGLATVSYKFAKPVLKAGKNLITKI